MITLFAELTAKAGEETILYNELQKMLLPSRSEDGCHAYVITQSTEDPTVFITYECFESMEAFESHVASDHYQNLLQKAGHTLAGEPKLTFTSEIPA